MNGTRHNDNRGGKSAAPARVELIPTADQTFEIRGGDFARRLNDSRRAEREGDVERACEMRLGLFRRVASLLPDDEECMLEWNDANTRAAVETIYASAVDHFLIDDFDTSAAMCELLLDVDPEDHCEATVLAAQCYAALGEYDSFEAAAEDMAENSAVRAILTMFVAFRREGRIPAELRDAFRRRHAVCYSEFTAASHAADADYLRDIESAEPSAGAQARELWLRTENLWRLHPEFIAALGA